MNFDIANYSTPWKYNKEVLGPSGIKGDYAEKAVDSPFVFYHAGKYYMMHVGFDGIGYQTALACSEDLLNWEKGTTLFRREELSGWDKGGIAGVWILKENDLHDVPKLKKWNGYYWMIYHSYPNEGYEAGPASIGVAYTQDETLQKWERFDKPILSWEDGAAWEKSGLYKGCLIEHEGKFYMFYNAKDSEEWLWHEQIGMAVSEDMIHWQRVFDTPVIVNGCSTWDSAFCADPCILRDEDEWLMFYYGYDGQHAREGLAYSRDLYHWNKVKEPILGNGDTGSLDELHAHKPSVIEKDGCLYHFYCAVRPSREGDNAWNQDPTKIEIVTGEYRCISVATSLPIEE